MRVTRFNFVGGWGIKLGKSYDPATDTLTVEIHNTVTRGAKGDTGAAGAAGAAGAPGAAGHDGYFPPLTADPTPPYAGYGYLNTATGKLAVWDGAAWWRTTMTQDIGGAGAFDPIYEDLLGTVDQQTGETHPLEAQLFA